MSVIYLHHFEDCERGGGRVFVRDRATVVAAAVLHIVATAPECERQQAVENYLHDEFSNIEAQQSGDHA